MLPTIRGPISFKKGEPIPEKVMKEIGEIALPFEATGWKSTQEMEFIPERMKKEIITEKIEPIKKTEEIKESKEIEIYNEKYLNSLTFAELRELAKEFGIKARSRVEFINEFRDKGIVE